MYLKRLQRRWNPKVNKYVGTCSFHDKLGALIFKKKKNSCIQWVIYMDGVMKKLEKTYCPLLGDLVELSFKIVYCYGDLKLIS